MDREQARRLALGYLFEGFLSSIENALTRAGTSPEDVRDLLDSERGRLSAFSGPVGAMEEAEPEPIVGTVSLADDRELEVEIKQEMTKGGRTRYFTWVDDEKILLTKVKEGWRPRKKAVRDFSSYELTEEDKAIIFKLADFRKKGKSPFFLELANSLDLSIGKLLGRYRNVSGAGYVEKDEKTGRYKLTPKGKAWVEKLNGPSAPARKRSPRGRRK